MDLLSRVGLATILGVLIGLERQWRSRMAGLQTMALVSMGSALYLILGAYSFAGSDPTRVAAQIVSGIGFLGAGVIMKHGLTITGLNTAATLWATAAVGALAGAWMWREAIAGALIIVAGNLVLHSLAGAMDRHGFWFGREAPPPTPRVLTVECATEVEPAVRRSLLDLLAEHGLRVTGLRSATRGVGVSEVRTDVEQTEDRVAETVVRTLALDDRVVAATWT